MKDVSASYQIPPLCQQA